MGQTARIAFVATLVVICLVFFGVVIAAAMRPGIDWLAEHRIPRPAGVALHYLAFAGALALLLWLVVPRAADQVSQALGTVPTSRQQLKQQAKHSSGIKHELLVGAQKR